MLMTGSYDYRLVALSVFLAICASFAALDLAGRVTAARSWVRLVWLGGGALVMGLGIWSTHFTGMLAFRLPVSVTYDWPTVLASLLASIFSSGTALYVVSRPKIGAFQVLTGGIIMGFGIAAMHYTAMAAMRMAATCRFNFLLVALSFLIAIAFSLAALWLAFYFLTDIAGEGWKKLASATQLGLAISVMHYCGMSSASFIPAPTPMNISRSVSISSLGTAAIAVTTLIVLGFAVWTSTLDRRLAAQSLELQSSECFRQIADNFQEVFVLSNADLSQFLYVNRAYRQIWGRTPESLYANSVSFLEGVHPEDRERLKQALEGLIKGEPIKDLECRVVRPDGSTSWVACRGYPVFDAQGQIHRLVGSAQDITQRKRAEEERRRSDELLRVAFEKAAVGFSLSDRNGRFLKVNQAFCRLTGFSAEELYAKDFQSITHAEDLPANLQGMDGLLAGEIVSFVYQKRYITKSGELVWVQNSIATIPDREGSVSGFVTLTEDITDRKRAEDALRESEDRYRDLVEHSYDLICTHDLEGILLSANETPLRILGYSRGELLNKPLRDFVTPEARPLCDAYLSQVQRDGFAKGLLPVLTKSGEVRVWEYNNSLRRDGAGPLVVRGLAHDVTDQKRTEEELRHLSRRLLQLRDEERRRIARDLHDSTGQDLVAVSTTLGQLQASIPSSSRKARKLIVQCQALTDSCLGEIRTLSYVLHPPMLEETGLEDAIRQYLDGFAERTGIEITMEIAPHFGRLTQDSELALFRVMQESLTNILRHSGSFTAKIKLHRGPETITLEVSDTGRGIFVCNQKQNGAAPLVAGVGIPSMQERVKQFGGRLDIESSGQGTTVRVTLPTVG
jgi:PAS domain S-box-containing protein